MEFDPERMKAALQTTEGQRLLRQLQADGGTALSQASEAFRTGDAARAVSMLQPMLQSKGAEQLLRELQKQLG